MGTTADIPHLDQPFSFGPVFANVVEQDSPEDIINCVAAILRTQIGERVDLPEFGIDQPTFETQPVDTNSIVEQIVVQEPRAAVIIDQNPSAFDSLILEMLVTVSQIEVSSDEQL